MQREPRCEWALLKAPRSQQAVCSSNKKPRYSWNIVVKEGTEVRWGWTGRKGQTTWDSKSEVWISLPLSCKIICGSRQSVPWPAVYFRTISLTQELSRRTCHNNGNTLLSTLSNAINPWPHVTNEPLRCGWWDREMEFLFLFCFSLF